mgnify:CR=1 FL=1|jgi:hypothetical protein
MSSYAILNNLSKPQTIAMTSNIHFLKPNNSIYSTKIIDNSNAVGMSLNISYGNAPGVPGEESFALVNIEGNEYILDLGSAQFIVYQSGNYSTEYPAVMTAHGVTETGYLQPLTQVEMGGVNVNIYPLAVIPNSPRVFGLSTFGLLSTTLSPQLDMYVNQKAPPIMSMLNQGDRKFIMNLINNKITFGSYQHLGNEVNLIGRYRYIVPVSVTNSNVEYAILDSGTTNYAEQSGTDMNGETVTLAGYSFKLEKSNQDPSFSIDFSEYKKTLSVPQDSMIMIIGLKYLRKFIFSIDIDNQTAKFYSPI